MGMINNKTVGEFINKMNRTKPKVKYYVSDGNTCYKDPKSEKILNKHADCYRIHRKKNRFDDTFVYIRFH